MADSLHYRNLRKVWRRSSYDIPVAPGTPLLVELGKYVEHTGIYLGRDKVAEVKDTGEIRLVSCEAFLHGDKRDGWLDRKVRTGRRIFAACDKLSGVPIRSVGAVGFALRHLHKMLKDGYDILHNNCHRFTGAAFTGGDGDTQSGKVYSIGWLTETLAKWANGGRDVDWRPAAIAC